MGNKEDMTLVAITIHTIHGISSIVSHRGLRLHTQPALLPKCPYAIILHSFITHLVKVVELLRFYFSYLH